jgi:hypothetical protein
MKRTLLGAAVLLAALSLCSTAPVAGQALASIAAGSSAINSAGPAGLTTAAAAQQKAGCWGCDRTEGIAYCAGTHGAGYWNCVGGGLNCSMSSPGCGGAASIPLDPDGATQYVSRGAAIGLQTALAESATPSKRNCEGVVVARYQTPENIATVRAVTGSLSL